MGVGINGYQEVLLSLEEALKCWRHDLKSDGKGEDRIGSFVTSILLTSSEMDFCKGM